MFCKTLVRGLVAAAVVASAVSARAVQDDVNLVGGWGISWNGQGTSPSQDIKIYDNTTPANGVFDGYELGLIFQRVSGSGELALNSALNPTSNSIVGSWSTTPAPTVTPFSDVYGAGIEQEIANVPYTSGTYTVPPLSSAASLVTVNFTASSVGASGAVFDVWADDGNGVDGANGWSDYDQKGGGTTNYTDCNTSNFLLGTVTVTATPEPSSLVLLGVAGLGLLSLGARRIIRRRNAPAA